MPIISIPLRSKVLFTWTKTQKLCCVTDEHKFGNWKNPPCIYYLRGLVSQLSGHGFTGYSAQGFKRLVAIQHYHPRLHEGRTCFQHCSGCWQQSFACDCITEGTSFLLTLGWRPISRRKSCQEFLRTDHSALARGPSWHDDFLRGDSKSNDLASRRPQSLF